MNDTTRYDSPRFAAKVAAVVGLLGLLLQLATGCAHAAAPAPAPAGTVHISPIEQSPTPRPFAKTAVITDTEEPYGADPLQVVTVARNHAVTTPGKTVIFIHGGGWNSGGRSSLADEAAEWAKTGWVSINVSYRLGVTDGVTGDGQAILADVLTVLNKYRAMPYVDPDKVIVYGESAGGHLATWLGAKYGPLVRGIVAVSPVSSIQGAITAGQAPGAPGKVVNLGVRAAEYFGYSVGTTDWHRYGDRVQHAAVAFSTDEWVDPDVHGRVFCAALGDRCTLFEFPGALHAGDLAAAQPQLLIDVRHLADTWL